MRAFILRKMQRKITTTPPLPCSNTAGSYTTLRSELPRKPAYAQEQCILFAKLSVELRLLIYHAALADPHRLLHFLHVTPYESDPAKTGHWRCEDVDSTYPIWQHRCFGCWVEGDTRYQRNASYTNSDLISLLLTCRSM